MEYIPLNNSESFWKHRVPFLGVVIFLLIISASLIYFTLKASLEIEAIQPVQVFIQLREKIVLPPIPEKKFKPGPISMEKIKTRGCVADGLLSGYGGDTKNTIKLIERSECVYLHRALETWAYPPKFEKAEEIMEKVDKPGLIYGMFLAEAIRRNVDYPRPDKERDFDFSEMCRKGTKNRWGEHTCIPDLNKEEYRDYLQYVTRRAMDIGIQSFLFGQIFLQDTAPRSESKLPKVIKEMRKYASQKGLPIIIGAQTNAITDENYLKMFDYVDGGVGLNSAGEVENGPCWSRKQSCWALLWHEDFRSRAKNVLLQLDWSGLSYDDMSVFSRMNQKTRIATLKNLYQKFTDQDVGFLMPFLATINRNNSNCHGPMKRFYSPDDKYSCNDEDEINAILRGE